MSAVKSFWRYCCCVFLLLSTSAQADLQRLIDQGVFNTLEQEAATAAILTYDRLITQSGCFDALLADRGEGDCSGQTFTLFSNVREIIHTANEIVGDGPTAFSLGSDTQGLGFALRWTAAEEYAAQGNLSSDFVGGQLSSIASRLTALRAGASGFSVIGLASTWNYDSEGKVASADLRGRRGSGASADGDGYGRLGGFLNYDFGRGKRVATELEDAFDFDNGQITLGLDYRLNDKWIVGAVVGLSSQEIDFDSSQSIVEGQIKAEGVSVMPFAMYQRNAWFVSTSMGWQNIAFDSERAIRYPSFNLDSASTDTVAVSTTDASMFALFLETGYTFSWRKFSAEPFVNIKYSDIAVDGFIEDDINNDAFDLVVEEQEISSQELTLGTKFQYTLTPSFGVFIPYLIVEAIGQTDDAPRTIEARYAQDATNESAFNVPTEALDSSYYAYTIGISSVIRGGREKQKGGVVGGDIQGFMHYKSLEGLEGFDIEVFSLGLRYTF